MIGNLTEEEIRELLRENTLGRLGCNDGNKTYVIPISYVFENNIIHAHSAEGMKINIMRKNPDVCFEVEQIKTYTRWKTVVAWGRYQELHDERDRYNAMKLFTDKLLHVKLSQSHAASLHSAGAQKSIIFRIIINELSGKFEEE